MGYLDFLRLRYKCGKPCGVRLAGCLAAMFGSIFAAQNDNLSTIIFHNIQPLYLSFCMANKKGAGY